MSAPEDAPFLPSLVLLAGRDAAFAGLRDVIGCFVAGATPAFSRTTSVATLSSLNPTNAGCLSAPASLHSVNFTSATSRGSTQWAPLASYPRGGFTKGGVF